MKKKSLSILFVVALMFGSLVLSIGAYADDGGAWFGDDSIGGSGGPGSGGGGSSSGSSDVDCSSAKGSYLLECMGYSWVFYKSVVPAEQAEDVKFLPNGIVTIPKICAEHTEQNGGFWHLGENGRGIKNSKWYTDYAYFGDFIYVEGIDGGDWDKTYTYSTAQGAYGHRQTYTYKYIKEKYPWAVGLYRTEVPTADGGSTTGVTMPLNNALYKNHKKIYEATKFSAEDGEVWEDYKAAYRAAHDGEEPTGIADNIYAFCYWEGLDDVQYFAKSEVYDEYERGTSTGIVGEFESVKANAVYLKTGSVITLDFSHSIYASAQADGVEWHIESSRSEGDGYIIRNYPSGGMSGVADLNVQDGDYYVSSNPIKTNTYEVVFNDVGDYEFCESLYVEDTKFTEVCYEVLVPYNFVNTATVSLSQEVVYAGETASIDYGNIIVNPKYNAVTSKSTDDLYATKVNGARIKMLSYLSTSSEGAAVMGYGDNNADLCNAIADGKKKNGVCDVLGEKDDLTLNALNNPSGVNVQAGFSDAYNVYDAMAGDYYCVVLAVYPSTSGTDTNMSPVGSGNWYVSAPSCSVISKRPSFQVWGGSLYSAAAIKAPASAKNNLSGITGYEYNVSNTNNTIVFGSWVEQSVIAGGLVNGLASGAATGLLNNAALNSLGITAGSPEGRNVSYCNNRVPLSLANYSNSFYNLCPYVQLSGNAGITTTTDRESLIDYLTSEDLINTGATGEGTTTNIVYESNTTDLTIGTTTTTTIIPQGTTRIITAPNNTITINGNIEYANYNATTSYTTLTTIPKLIIYANDIIIACNVNRIDAILIAKNNVNTCNSNTAAGETINDRKNSNPLTINGIITTNTLNLNRTYGATTGAGSSIPAEIINYDTSTILWGRDMANTDNYTGLTSVYQHELAPRY